MSVVELRPASPPAPEINTDAIELVEGTLARLRDGTIKAVAVVEVAPNGSVATHWSQTIGGFHHLCSGAARLLHRMCQSED